MFMALEGFEPPRPKTRLFKSRAAASYAIGPYLRYIMHRAKRQLLKDDTFVWECQSCKNTQWLGNSIPLELHHIDGDRCNDNIDNLQLLCPNCHTFTPNYRGKNKFRKIKPKCLDCGKEISFRSKYCSTCFISRRGPTGKTKINWPSTESIVEKVKSSGFSALSRELGVTDNTIRKHLRKNGITDFSSFKYAKHGS
jgi:hypothetical protein